MLAGMLPANRQFLVDRIVKDSNTSADAFNQQTLNTVKDAQFSWIFRNAAICWRREWRCPWWRVAFGYVLLALVMDRVLWDPHTGALMRVLLPLTVGFNLQLLREPRASRLWPWLIAGNLHLAGVLRVMPLV